MRASGAFVLSVPACLVCLACLPSPSCVTCLTCLASLMFRTCPTCHMSALRAFFCSSALRAFGPYVLYSPYVTYMPYVTYVPWVSYLPYVTLQSCSLWIKIVRSVKREQKWTGVGNLNVFSSRNNNWLFLLTLYLDLSCYYWFIWKKYWWLTSPKARWLHNINSIYKK